jgi:hypothetical protein
MLIEISDLAMYSWFVHNFVHINCVKPGAEIHPRAAAALANFCIVRVITFVAGH